MTIPATFHATHECQPEWKRGRVRVFVDYDGEEKDFGWFPIDFCPSCGHMAPVLDGKALSDGRVEPAQGRTKS